MCGVPVEKISLLLLISTRSRARARRITLFRILFPLISRFTCALHAFNRDRRKTIIQQQLQSSSWSTRRVRAVVLKSCCVTIQTKKGHFLRLFRIIFVADNDTCRVPTYMLQQCSPPSDSKTSSWFFSSLYSSETKRARFQSNNML